MAHANPKTVLLINASARGATSNSRALAQNILTRLEQTHGSLVLRERDVARGLPLIDERWVAANFTAPGERTTEQAATLALSDALIAELQAADIVVIAAPMYNFGIPASLKAWVDQVARAGVTFRYTAQGPQGLLAGKQAYVVVTTGGAQIGSAADFASGYIKHVLGFIGIDDVRLIAAERYDAGNAERHAQVEGQIAAAVAALATRAAA